MMSILSNRKIFAALLMAFSSASSFSYDLGVMGNVWEVIERDVRELFLESASQADLKKVENSLRESAESYLDRLAKRKLPSPSENVTVWFDPSIILENDIKAPVKTPSGEYAWQVFYRKGEKVNPLEKYRPPTFMLFFDGSDKDQVELVAAAIKRDARFIPVEAGSGSIKASMEKMNRPVFHANDQLISRFGIRFLPTVTYTGYGNHSMEIGITSLSKPYDKNYLYKAVNLIPEKQKKDK